MKNLPIHGENIHLFAYTNADILQHAPRGIVLSFHGLNGSQMIKEHSGFAAECAGKDLLLVCPYDNPWSWMNDLAVRTLDEIVGALLEKYGSLPIISTGGSMGGLSCLIYARYSRHAITACAANCPVCDLPYHYTERPDLPRTIVSALCHYDMELPEAMESISPLHQAGKLPDIPYFIAHCEEDQAVNQQMHSEKLLAAMKKAGRRVEYISVPGRGHCDLSPEARAQYNTFIFRHCGV